MSNVKNQGVSEHSLDDQKKRIEDMMLESELVAEEILTDKQQVTNPSRTELKCTQVELLSYLALR